MADKPSDDRASFGFYPQLKRNRSKQDREAAKNVPVDLARGFVSGVLGAPGDIESFLRIPYDYLRAPTMSELVTGDKTSKTYLPTSEDIEKRLPFRSDTPVSKAASGLGTLGGGFYFGPGSPLKVIGALPSAVRHGAQEFAKASYAGAPRVVKPKGGNWLNRSVENELKPLKRSTASGGDPAQTLSEIRERFTPEAIANLPEGAGKEHVLQSIDQLEKDIALNSWIDSNLTNYVKKQMATPEDPVRKLAEQDITHFPIAEDPTFWNRQAESARGQLGGTQMAQSDLAKQWENRSDSMIGKDTAQEFQDMMRQAPGMFDKESDWIKKLPPETDLYKTRGVGRRFNPQDLGFDHVLDVLRQDVAAGRIRPEQLNKVSMEQAVRRTYEYDQEMAKQMREANFKITEGFPLHKEYPEGYKWIELAPPKELPAGYRVIQSDMGEGFKVLDAAGNEAVATASRPTNNMGHTNIPFHKTEQEAIADALKYDKRLEEALKYEGKTMGHCVGGYCPDVVEGKSRIFSLRDAKGEPHVTVEVQPDKTPPRIDQIKQYMAAATEEAKQLPQGYTDRDISNIATRMAIDNAPPAIVQIKGKQNLRPIEKYDPYTQDFVRSREWNEINDLHNTGLQGLDDAFPDYQMIEAFSRINPDKKFVNQKEIDDFIKQFNKPQTPPEGMKRGGRVSISKNLDTMMLEVNNRKMAKGGKVVKELLGALKKPEVPPMGINVRTDSKLDLPYADLIVDGQKLYESRKTDSLRPYVNQSMSIVRTGNAPAKAIGSVDIGEPLIVDAKTFREMQDKHLVPEGSMFDIEAEGQKYLYPLTNPRRFEQELDVGRGIKARKVIVPAPDIKKAQGGYIKKPAAYIDGNEFVLAAKKYGIKDSMNNLNKIVDLVNKGLSVDDAARQVADSGVHKAAGGAVNADDLILEERPL